MLKEWRYQFDYVTLCKAYRLANHFLVKKDASGLFQVFDQNVYQVSIELKDGRPYQSHCSCGSKEPCCHVAACFIYLDYSWFYDQFRYYEPQHIMSSMDEKTKDTILTALFSYQYDYLNQLLEKYPRSYEQVEIFKLDQLFSQKDLFFAINQYLTQDLLHLFQNKAYLLCLGLLMQLHTRLKLLDHHYLELESMILDLFDDFLNLKDVDYEGYIFDYFMADYQRQTYLDFIFNHFKHQPYLEIKKVMLDYLIKRIQAIVGVEANYFLNDYLTKQYEVLELLQDEASLNKTLIKYQNEKATKIYLIQSYLRQHQIEKAIEEIQTLLNGKDLNRFTVLKYQRILLELYREISLDLYKKQLKLLFLHLDPAYYDDYIQLKKICDKQEWLKIKQDLLNSGCDLWRLYDILFSEGDLNILLPMLLGNLDGLYVISHRNDFEKVPSQVMIPFISQLVIRLYKKRDVHYQKEMLTLLHYLETFEEGSEAAYYLVEEIKKRHE